MSFREISADEWPYILHPRPVAVVVSGSWDDYSAMPASWVMPVSRKPPIVAVAIARTRYTYSLIARYKEFALCILGIDRAREIHAMGSVSGRDVRDKISYAGLTKARGKKVSCPIIAESLAVAECTLVNDIEAGDHNLVLGRVLTAYIREGIKLLDPNTYTIALHIGRNRYTKPGAEVIEV
ncbi:MAG: flavin reductase family protein [Ignisphaera sp.]|nr:flavin reductase family protein [Ignisphaera sp.]